ncbi:methylated-DNA--[protein]-cysteine S-methyltransferase [Nocardia macrotermitis]|uniref:Methylated-DNA--protein-cysteine methyltransferase n=1 Tax=Nocardia macrotermitis TaxID=2585198 RepID=A0A7K0D256_9NOCA|nr:methylated-DNA--[protein]-cysteine S-methyltransferase [Nocardia macrotermitis]MQY19805.1 Methylated-DNA--protein-cysteine methyltransferase [Nocardia macrotermitis]
MSSAEFATVSTSLGPFTTVVDADGAVLAAGWTADSAGLWQLVHPRLRNGEPRQRDSLGEVTDAVEKYHAGTLSAIDDIPVNQISGPFLQHAWDVLRTVAPGNPITYTAFAARSGRPEAIRAAANACARNAAALFVPCHRILRTDGTLGGFRWGLDIKARLIRHEQSAAPAH